MHEAEKYAMLTGWKASTPIGTTCKKGKTRLTTRNCPRENYRLVVKATDRNGQWQAPVTLLSLTQLPAWYETIWAYAAYVTAALLLIYVLLRLYLQRLRSRNRLQLQEALTQAKLDYFTNISHDLLTPLSVISCVGDYWERQYPAEERQTTVLRHNIYRLKRLLQQVLDFRKTENGNMYFAPKKATSSLSPVNCVPTISCLWLNRKAYG